MTLFTMDTVLNDNSNMESLWQKGSFKKIFERLESKNNKSNADELKKGFEPHLNQPLHYAACRGNLEVVRKLIETYRCQGRMQGY